jgi:hypothetical protein
MREASPELIAELQRRVIDSSDSISIEEAIDLEVFIQVESVQQ